MVSWILKENSIRFPSEYSLIFLKDNALSWACHTTRFYRNPDQINRLISGILGLVIRIQPKPFVAPANLTIRRY